MATLKVNGTNYLVMSDKVTTPSIHIQKDGNHWYVPLFSGSKGAVVQSGDYKYTLGGLNVGSYRAAISREVAIAPEDDPGVQIGGVVFLGTHSEQAQYLVGQTFNFTPGSDTPHNREIGSPILYPSGTDYHHVSETRYRITEVNKRAFNSATISGVKLKFNSPDTGEWFIGFDKDGVHPGNVNPNVYGSHALALIPYTIGSNITTPVATFKVTRAMELPSGARAVYGTHVSGIVS